MNTNKSKIISKRKVNILSAAFFISILLLNSCKKEDSNIGDSLQSESLNLAVTDTFTINTYSDEVDSLDSDETSVGLLGYYKDPVFGDVDCGVVTQLRLSSPVTSFDIGEGNAIVDSVVLGLRYTDINYYANLSDITVEAYEVSNELTRDNQEYYTFELPANEGVNLVEAGYETVSPDVIAQQYLGNGDTLDAHLRVRLDPSVGQSWLDDHNVVWSSEDDFIGYFAGLYVKVDGSMLSSGEGTVLYFSMEDALSNVMVYYHYDTDATAREFEFSINSASARYNYMDFDRTGTDVEALLTGVTDGSESFYMQGSSIRAVVEFPHIMDFNYDAEGNYDPKIINQAILILPIQDYTPEPFDPSTHLFIARIIDEQLSTATIDFGGATSSGTVSYNEDDKEFRFTMTRELIAILNGSVENQGYRIYAPSFFGSSIERVIFNGSNTSLKEKPRLQITYTEY